LGWVWDGSFRKSACFDFQYGRHGHHLEIVSVDYLTNTWVDWSDFFLAYWGRLEEGAFQWPVPLLIHDGRYGSHLGLGFCRLFDEPLGRLVQLFCGFILSPSVKSILHPLPIVWSALNVYLEVPGSNPDGGNSVLYNITTVDSPLFSCCHRLTQQKPGSIFFVVPAVCKDNNFVIYKKNHVPCHVVEYSWVS
jgi:hypothetical protein